MPSKTDIHVLIQMLKRKITHIKCMTLLPEKSKIEKQK